MAKVNYDPVEEAYKKKNKAVDKSTEANAVAYDAQRSDIAESAGDAMQQAYIQRNRARELLAQQNKAAGITGGAAESAHMVLEANYNTNRTNAAIERDKQISQVNIAQQQTEAQAEMEKASDNVGLETGRLSFDQDEANTHRSELWELVRAGVITEQIAAELGHDINTLRTVYERRYKPEEE